MEELEFTKLMNNKKFLFETNKLIENLKENKIKELYSISMFKYI